MGGLVKFKAAVTTFTTGKIWINKGLQLQVGIFMIFKNFSVISFAQGVTRFSQAGLYLDCAFKIGKTPLPPPPTTKK